MSTLQVTYVKSTDANTPLTLQSANASGGQIVLQSANNDVLFVGPLRFTANVTGDGSGFTLPSSNVANAAFGVANAAFGSSNTLGGQSNSVFGVANAAFGKANTALQNTTGNFAGTLGITGSLGVGTTSITSELTLDGILPKLEVRSGGYLMMRPVANNWDMRVQANGATLRVFSGGDLSNSITTFVHGGYVGIGTDSPSTKLHVYGTGDPVITSESSQAGQAGQFKAVGNGASSYPGFNLYQGSTGYWSMQMRADTHLYLFRQTGSGNVYIPGGDLVVTGAINAGGPYSSATNSIALNNGRILMTKNDDWGMEMAGSNGTRIRFYSSSGGQGTTVGSVQVDGTSAYYYTGNLYVYRQGIKFPATQESSADANILDDYEEGSWTPVFTADTPPTGVTYSSRVGTYTKIGNLVYVRCTILLSSKGTGGSGTVYITGLPFNAAGLAGYAYQNLGGLCYPQSGDTFTAIYGAVYDSGAQIVTHSAPGATSTIAWSSYGNSSKISFSGSYRIE